MSGISSIPAFSTPSLPPSNKIAGTLDSNPETRRATKELEATFLTMLLKEMRQTLEPDGGLFPGDTGDVQGGLFDLYLGQHLAAAGGFGLAAALDRQLRTPSNADHRSPPAGGTVALSTDR
ncbi:MAG: rod-binding protein [Fimbriiglobus sp.]|jgi:flagellar protein FlgJ|nr:rod-binding protein [Fimbriiglobus sp.]